MTVEIITRAQWGARYAPGFGPAPLPAREVWLHHSETVSAGPLAPLAADMATIVQLERIGQQRFGGGISYTFCATEAGRVFEGHGVDRRGAHTRGRNTVGRAIVLVGGYQTRMPTEVQRGAVARLLAYGAHEGWWTRPELAGGHRDAPGAATACPGDRAWSCIRSINAAAQGHDEQGDDMFTDADRALLVATHAEATKRLTNRRGAGGIEPSGPGADTVLGYAANADGFGIRAEHSLTSLLLAVDEANRRLGDLAARMDRMENRT